MEFVRYSPDVETIDPNLDGLMARIIEFWEKKVHDSPRTEGTGRAAEVLVDSERVLASVCEAIIGASYLAFGLERTAPAVVESFRGEIEQALGNPVDYKSVLQERLARRAEVVLYRTVSEEGPAHDRSFIAVAEVDGQELGRGEGKTKKAAEQEAALHALDTLEMASET